MAEIIWAEPALNDLNDIAEYIALENVSAAKAFVQMVISKLERLADFPESGRIPPELTGPSYREVIASSCRIIYKHEDNSVHILYVMREERDLRRFLLEHTASTRP